jgi:hypothetical protein
MKLKIINKNDGNETILIKRLIRNITWLLGPLDILSFLITQERIGDKIAGTNVVEEKTNSYLKIEPGQNTTVKKGGGGFAIASLVLGIIGIFFAGVPGIIGFIFSFKGINSEKKGIAIAGLVLNSFQIIILIFLVLSILVT